MKKLPFFLSTLILFNSSVLGKSVEARKKKNNPKSVISENIDKKIDKYEQKKRIHPAAIAGIAIASVGALATGAVFLAKHLLTKSNNNHENFLKVAPGLVLSEQSQTALGALSEKTQNEIDAWAKENKDWLAKPETFTDDGMKILVNKLKKDLGLTDEDAQAVAEHLHVCYSVLTLFISNPEKATSELEKAKKNNNNLSFLELPASRNSKFSENFFSVKNACSNISQKKQESSTSKNSNPSQNSSSKIISIESDNKSPLLNPKIESNNKTPILNPGKENQSKGQVQPIINKNEPKPVLPKENQNQPVNNSGQDSEPRQNFNQNFNQDPTLINSAKKDEKNNQIGAKKNEDNSSQIDISGGESQSDNMLNKLPDNALNKLPDVDKNELLNKTDDKDNESKTGQFQNQFQNDDNSSLDKENKDEEEKNRIEELRRKKQELSNRVNDITNKISLGTNVTQEVNEICGNAIEKLKKDEVYLTIRAPHVVVFGDFHGHLPSFIAAVNVMFRMLEEDPNTVFLILGDFCQRSGSGGIEILILMCLLKAMLPENFYYTAGNHEMHGADADWSSDLKKECKNRKVSYLHPILIHVYRYLSLGANLNDTVFCSHGGIPKVDVLLNLNNEIKKPISLGEFKQTTNKNTQQSITNMLSGCNTTPIFPEIDGKERSKNFSKDQLDDFLRKSNFKKFIAGHTHPVKGYEYLVFADNSTSNDGIRIVSFIGKNYSKNGVSYGDYGRVEARFFAIVNPDGLVELNNFSNESESFEL